MDELGGLLKKEKALQLAMRIIAVLAFAGGLAMIKIQGAIMGILVITYKWNRYVPKNPHRLFLSFHHSELDRCYNLSATDSQVLAELSDAGTMNLLLELAPLHPIISIKNRVVCVAIYTENRILNYDYKAGFEPHTEYAKIQGELERERRIMNILQ